MKEKIEKLYIDALYNDVAPNVFAEQVLDLFIVSKPFVTATETTGNILKGKNYALVEEESMGYYIIDETSDEAYYNYRCFNVC